ncbi:MAG: MerR family transcriptional regulator [Archaeoglobus sp.]|nr:MerR family transcriptional regulator [Archaeoglobus sp.]
MEEYLKIADVAKQVGIPETTARRYAELFKEYLHHKTFGRTKKYKPEAVQIMQKISGLYQEGKTTEEIREILGYELPQVVDAVEEKKYPDTATLPPHAFLSMMVMQAQENQQLKEYLYEQAKTIQRLQETVEQMNSQLAKIEQTSQQDTIKTLNTQISSLEKRLEETYSKRAKELEDKLNDIRLKLEERKKRPWWKFWD